MMLQLVDQLHANWASARQPPTLVSIKTQGSLVLAVCVRTPTDRDDKDKSQMIANFILGIEVLISLTNLYMLLAKC